MINGAAARTTRGVVRTLQSGTVKGTWSADFIRAAVINNRASKAGHMTASRIDHRLNLTLASMGPSTHDNTRVGLDPMSYRI